MAHKLALINLATNICDNITLDERPAAEIAIDGYLVLNLDDIGGGGPGAVWDGEKLAYPAPSPVVPEAVTPRQVRLLLLQQDLLADVEAMIAQQDEATRITWEYAQEFRRDNPLLGSLAASLGLTEAQIDEFFIAAAQL